MFVKERLSAYAQLTKPRIVLLFVLTGMTAMVVEGSMMHDPLRFWLVTLAITLTAGSANAFNQYLDRDIDAVMERTAKKRPLPQKRITANEALVFAFATGTLATWMLYAYGSPIASFWGFFTIFFYVVVYTMWLKRSTPYNIVIGGAAGATAPLIGWAAATGSTSLTAWALFAVIFMWTPPHFWALALCMKDEYAEAGVPMLPVVKGEENTRRQILAYTIALVPFSFFPLFTGHAGAVYAAASILLGFEFIRRATHVVRRKDVKSYWRMFGYSIAYLLLLFVALMVDAGLTTPAHAAEKTPAELQGIGIEEHLGDRIDQNLEFRDENGQTVRLSNYFDGRRPVVLMLAYYGCPNLCNLFLNGMTDTMKELKWMPGRDYIAITASFDPREEAALAADKKATHIEALGKPAAALGWHWLVNAKTLTDPAAPTSTKALADKIGFKFRWDKETEQYAHTAAAIFLTPEGKISRYLYGISFTERDMRMALTEASNGKIGTIVDKILLFCFHYDPHTRQYTPYAINLMRIAALITVIMLAMVLVPRWRRRALANEVERRI